MAAGIAVAEAFTEDSLLGGQVILRQPAAGYRAAIDPVLLAAAVPGRRGERVLDMGTGAGAAALCLARRIDGLLVTGIEKDRALARLAIENAALNGLSRRVEVIVGDLAAPPPKLAPGSFDHVMANPPYFEAGATTPPRAPGRRAATVEGEADLKSWLSYALVMIRPGGTLTLIHRADRLAELLSLLDRRAGDVVVFPLWPHDPLGATGARPAKRLIIQARSGSRAPLRLAGGLVLHRADGGYTALAERVLRAGAALEL